MEVMFIVFLLLLFCVIFFVAFWGIRLSKKGAARLPRLESFFSLPSRTVRWGAFLFGTAVFSALFSVYFYSDDWHVLSNEDSTVVSASGEQLFLFEMRSVTTNAEGKMRTLRRGANSDDLALDSPEFAERAKAEGFWRLDDLAQRRPELADNPVFIHAHKELISAFSLANAVPSSGAPIWRGWLTHLIGDARDPVLQSSLWCGFDVTAGTPERVCFLGLPVPVFQRLYLGPAADQVLHIVGPVVHVRLDAAGGRVIDTSLTHRDYKRTDTGWQPENADQLVSFTLAGQSQLSWDILLKDQIPIEMAVSAQARVVSSRDLWTKREILAQDKWLFAGQGRDGFSAQTRQVDRPLLIDLAYDFLQIAEGWRTDENLRTWVAAGLGAKALKSLDDDADAACRSVMDNFRQSFDQPPEPIETLLPRRGRTSQAVFIGKTSCPPDFSGILLFDDWAKR